MVSPVPGPVPDQTHGTASTAGRGESLPKGKDGTVHLHGLITNHQLLTHLMIVTTQEVILLLSVQLQHDEDSDTFGACWVILLFP